MDRTSDPLPGPWLSSTPAGQTPTRSSTAMWRETGTVNMTQPQNTLNAPTGTATVVNVTHVRGDETHDNLPAREIAIPPPKADHEIYYHQLLTKKRGSPLWIPGPGRRLPIVYRRQGISIGDVGIITHFGRFDFLFNIFQPADHPINSRGVPESFSPLDFGQVETDPNTIYGCNTYLTSSSVNTLSVNSSHVHRLCIPRYFIDYLVHSGLIFESTAQEAAILTMPEGALTEDVLNGQVIRDCIVENARAWYEYARRRRGRIVQNGEIRVVVGWDKVRSWGIATSICTSGQSASLTFKINDETGASRAYGWHCIGSGSGRVGPPEDEISDLRREDNPTPQNQCVFVRTMNFTLAGHIWDDYSATALQEVPVSCQDNPQGLAPTHHTAGGGTGSASGVASSESRLPTSSVHGGLHTLQSVTFDDRGPGIDHPSSSIHKHLLEKYANATIVITQDADWISALTYEDTGMPQPEDLCARIFQTRIVYERDGMVTIQENPGDPDTCNTIISAGGPTDRHQLNKKGFLNTLSGSKRAADTNTIRSLELAEDLYMHPLIRFDLNVGSGHSCPLLWDLRQPPESARRVVSADQPITPFYLSRLATSPPTAILHITCDVFPGEWPIEVRRLEGITVGDVLRAIHTTLMRPILLQEWKQIAEKQRNRVSVAFEQRCKAAVDGGECRSRGVLRIDCLLQHTLFAGLSPSLVTNSSCILTLQRAGGI